MMSSKIQTGITFLKSADCQCQADFFNARGRVSRFLLAGCSSLFILLIAMSALAAEDQVTGQADQPLKWRSVRKLIHTQVTHKSTVQDKIPVERFRLQNQGTPEEVEIRAGLPASMLHNDFEASVKVHSTAAGLHLGLVLILPHQPDPRTGKPLESIVVGDTLRSVNQWQTMNVKVTQKVVEAALRRIRADLNRPDIRTQEAIIAGLAIVVEASPGEAFFDIGEARFGPLIEPSKALMQLVSSPQTPPDPIEQVRSFIPLDVELGGLMLGDQPVILRLAPDHGEQIETIRQFRLNAVWVPDYRDTDRAKELFDAKIGVLATPPHPEFEPGDFSRLIQALPPLDQQCPNVSAWIQGTRVTPEEHAHLLAWSREVRSADRTFQRLQMADVTAAEGAVAREIDLVGIGRHVVGRDMTFGALRNLLVRRQQSGGQLSCPWTWVQTEPSSAQQAWRQNLGFRPATIEPEQIQQGVYAALSAGYKGVGFWKTHALELENPADRETAIAIELACMEIELLEPFLARGRIDGYLALQTRGQEKKPRGRGAESRLNSALGGRTVGATVSGYEGPETHDAAVISGKGNTLILATAWDNVSQFVPGPMYEKEVSLVVASSETASAWQISTTGVYGLPREVTAGGLALKISDFDQCAALIISSNPTALLPGLEQKIHALAPVAAARLAELASLKYVRVLRTVEMLRAEHTVPPNVDALLSQSKQLLDRSEFELSTNDYHEAALRARDAMRYARQAQHVCWNDAIRNLTSPSATPHAASFSTLPDHWKLMHYLEQQQQRLSDNLLASGDFEALRSVSQNGWKVDVLPKSAYLTTTDIVQDSRAGRTLRMIAWKSADVAHTVQTDAMPLLVTTPEIPVSSGDVMLVTGRVRKGPATSLEARRPLVIFDSELGPESSVRADIDSEWSRFEIIRPVGQSSTFSVTLGLMGHASVEEVLIDDLSIRKLPALTASGAIQLTGSEKSLEASGDDPSPENSARTSPRE